MRFSFGYLFLFICIHYAPVECTTSHRRRNCDLMTAQCIRGLVQDTVPFFINGSPEHGIPSLDPFKVENINLTLPGGLTIDVTEGNTKGLRKCHVDSAEHFTYPHGTQYQVKLSCNLLIKGKYKSKGQLLMFPIDAEGDSTIKCKNLKITCTFGFVPIRKLDGKEYLKIQDFNATHSFEGKVSFHLTNLFQGNPGMSKSILKFLNENWRLVAKEFGGPFIEYGVNGVLNNVEKILNIVPTSELVEMFVG